MLSLLTFRLILIFCILLPVTSAFDVNNSSTDDLISLVAPRRTKRLADCTDAEQSACYIFGNLDPIPSGDNETEYVDYVLSTCEKCTLLKECLTSGHCQSTMSHPQYFEDLAADCQTNMCTKDNKIDEMKTDMKCYTKKLEDKDTECEKINDCDSALNNVLCRYAKAYACSSSTWDIVKYSTIIPEKIKRPQCFIAGGPRSTFTALGFGIFSVISVFGMWL